MSARENKEVMQAIFAALASGDGQPFVDAMTDDFTWTISGSGPWGRSWRGKDVVRKELFRPLFAQFEGTYRNAASRFVAEDDVVVVECRGNVATKAGPRYDNSYCYVCRFGADGKLVELTEYMDTALCERVLVAPAAA
jgi:uncharacterized protein